MSKSKRSNEPFLWLLFSAGGVVAAILIPVHLLLFGIAFPLGWLPALKALKFSLPLKFSIASAMIERAELPVHRKRTL